MRSFRSPLCLSVVKRIPFKLSRVEIFMKGWWGRRHSSTQDRKQPAKAEKTQVRDEPTKSEDAATRVKFKLGENCCLVLQRGDLTKWHVNGKDDAIVNAANTGMLGGGGVDGAIRMAAGPDLLEACYKLPQKRPGVRCDWGEAVITEGFLLPVSRIIHTVGPVYKDDEVSTPVLQNAYRNSLTCAATAGIKYISFPAISCGIYGYPYNKAAIVAMDAVQEFADKFTEIHFVLFEPPAWKNWLAVAEGILEKMDCVNN